MYLVMKFNSTHSPELWSTCNRDVPTILYEDSVACIAQIKEEFIKGDNTNHMSPKFIFSHDFQKECDINIQKTQSINNLANLFTKALATSKFEKMEQNIGMRRFKEIK